MFIEARVIEIETMHTLYTRLFAETEGAEEFKAHKEVPGETLVRFKLIKEEGE